MVQKKIDKSPAGSNDTQRYKATSLVWGQVVDNAGNVKTARMSGPDAYTLTAHSTLLIIKKVLAGDFKTGYQTPASAYGQDLVLQIEGVKREIVS